MESMCLVAYNCFVLWPIYSNRFLVKSEILEILESIITCYGETVSDTRIIANCCLFFFQTHFYTLNTRSISAKNVSISTNKTEERGNAKPSEHWIALVIDWLCPHHLDHPESLWKKNFYVVYVGWTLSRTLEN